ncbi:unnamed protein product [Ilex paraguariensis]|uniref:TypA/BipA C-terminal domain-containing protein n=1 Tax=Ilex paraguariensis TaxID=185542 RepID=A0ABC8TUI0_9AQUA
MAEAETNLAINVIPTLSDSYEVQGRGELQLGVSTRILEDYEVESLCHKLANNHYRLSLGWYLMAYKGLLLSPRYVMFSNLLETDASYAKYRGSLGNVRKGVLVSMGYGAITAHALMSLEARGTLFVNPGMETYDGMIVGEHSRDTDLDVNPVRTKELTNIRSAGKDENVKLSPPRLMTLEEAIGYVASDELIEVTPKAIRLRKRYLDAGKRKTMRNKPKD